MISGQIIARQQERLQQQQQQQQSNITRKYDNTASSTGVMIDRIDHRTNGDGPSLNCSNLQQQQQTMISQNNGSNPSVLSGHQSDNDNDNSTSSWSANSLNGSNGFPTSKRPAAGQRLSVILPQTQKSLLTPTIALTNDQGGTPNHLFSSLIQLNGQEAGCLFTGLPSCTPTSADGLARACINPFFWSVQQQQQQQKSPNHQMTATSAENQQHLVSSNNNNDGDHLVANYNNPPSEQTNNRASAKGASADAEGKERRRQLSKLSIDQLQAANTMILTSPLTSFLLSPENEAWLRLNFQSHPLSGQTIGVPQQQHQPNQNPNHASESAAPPASATSHAAYASGQLEAPPATSESASQLPSVLTTSYSSQQRKAQDLTSNQMIASRLNNGTAALAVPNHTQAQRSISQSPATVGQTQSPITSTASTQYHTSGGYDTILQHPVSVPPSQTPIIHTSSSSFINGHQQQQQHHHQLVSADFVSNSSQLQAQQQQPSVVTSYTDHSSKQANSIVHPIISGQQSKTVHTRTPVAARLMDDLQPEREASGQLRTHSSMGPPVAHHQQHPQQNQHHQHQGSLLVMGPRHLDPRFVEFQHHAPSLNSLDYDGASKSIGFYDPHLQQLFLAQKHQQEMYNLHQHQHQQHHHNQQQYLSYQQQQQTLPPYHHMSPNEQVQQHQQQQPPQAQPTTGYPGPTSHNATTENDDLNNNTSSTHHTDISSNSTGSSSANVSPHHQDHQIVAQSCNDSSVSSSARSSVSRDTNSIDVIATSGFKTSNNANGQIRNGSATKTHTRLNNSTKQSNHSKQNAKQQTIKKNDDKPVIGATNTNGLDGQVVKKKSKGGRKKKIVTNEELLARKNRSKERNRVAAKRCRQKRKQFLDELRGRIDNLNDSNKKLSKENNQLKSELEQLRKHHKVCVAT